MATSQNGWPASPDLPLRDLRVGGAEFVPGIRDHDDVAIVLGYVAREFHQRVESLAAGWCWGFSFRENRNDPNSLSNHSSGTAIDCNAPRHPNGVPTAETFTPAQIAIVHQILDEVDHVVRWGGDFRTTPDAMHFEINADEAAVAVVAARIREQEWFEMATIEDLRAVVREELEALMRTELENGKTVKNNIRSAGDCKALLTAHIEG